MNRPFKVLCIGGSDSGGGAGIQADLKAVSACGCYALTVITALTAQNTRGVQDIYPVPQKFIAAQLDAVLSDIGADALKTGMMLTAGAVNAVVRKIEQYGLKNVVVDPVMIAKGGRTMMQEAAQTGAGQKAAAADQGSHAKYSGSGISDADEDPVDCGDEESRGRHLGSWREKCCD